MGEVGASVNGLLEPSIDIVYEGKGFYVVPTLFDRHDEVGTGFDQEMWTEMRICNVVGRLLPQMREKIFSLRQRNIFWEENQLNSNSHNFISQPIVLQPSPTIFCLLTKDYPLPGHLPQREKHSINNPSIDCFRQVASCNSATS